MADKIKKLLAKLTPNERQIVKLLILRIQLDDTLGLDIKQLKGHADLFRVRKARLRIVYRKTSNEFLIVRIDRRNEKTYKDLRVRTRRLRGVSKEIAKPVMLAFLSILG